MRRLAPVQADPRRESLRQRVCEALDGSATEPWISALADLLAILGDKEEGVSTDIGTLDQVATVTTSQKEAMRRNWHAEANCDEILNRIFALRTLYDWPALKAAINVCPAADSDHFQLTDLFNILDMHSQSGHGFRVKQDELLAPQRVVGARNALKMLLQVMFYIDWHQQSRREKIHLNHHYNFAVALGRRMQEQGLKLAQCGYAFDSRDFYLGDVSFASMNYDPIALWCQFVANRNLNQCHSRNVSPPASGSPTYRLQNFHDLAHFVAGPRVMERNEREMLWHPMNESSAQRLNDPDHGASDRIRISKFLFPHGCLWWRECPDCGKLSSYMGDEWHKDSPTLIPPPPLAAFVRNVPDMSFRSRVAKQDQAWEMGKVDARACVHCGTLTYAHHTPLLMQSNFKSAPPPFIEEIKRDLRIAVQNADHIVLMGYSLPPDDMDYRAFFAARRRRDPDSSVKCSVVVGHTGERRWLGSSEWRAELETGDMEHGEPPRTTLEAARDLFGEENVRFYGGGIPDVFLEGGVVTDSAVERLLIWENDR